MIRLALVLSLVGALTSTARAQPSLVTSTNSAQTVPKGRFELGLFQPLRYGLTERVELSTVPLLVALMPQVEAKVRWLSQGHYSIATRQGVSYPSPLLHVLAREGSFGLLPKTSKIPTAFIFDIDGLFTRKLCEEHLLTALLGASAAPRGSTARMPLLDFPFLYARFAVLKTAAVYRLGLSYSGALHARIRASADVKYFILPVIHGGFSVEQGASLRFLLAKHVALEAGARLEYARYPSGLQFHYLPFLDVLVAW